MELIHPMKIIPSCNITVIPIPGGAGYLPPPAFLDLPVSPASLLSHPAAFGDIDFCVVSFFSTSALLPPCSLFAFPFPFPSADIFACLTGGLRICHPRRDHTTPYVVHSGNFIRSLVNFPCNLPPSILCIGTVSPACFCAFVRTIG